MKRPSAKASIGISAPRSTPETQRATTCSTDFAPAKTRSAHRAAELGDISGKRVLHLQCCIGHDSLYAARRGAISWPDRRQADRFARKILAPAVAKERDS